MSLIITESRIVEDVLRRNQKALGDEFLTYRSHCYRVLNYTLALQRSSDHGTLLAVCAAFHDLGIWTHQTMDYLQISCLAAEEYVRKGSLKLPMDILRGIILDHHQILPNQCNLMSAHFRRADLTDLTFWKGSKWHSQLPHRTE